MDRARSERTPESADSSGPAVVVTGDGDRLTLQGDLVLTTLASARQSLTKWGKRGTSRALDVAGLDRLDTPGALLLCNLAKTGVDVTGVRAEHRALLELIRGLDLEPLPHVASVPRWREIVIRLGKGAHDARHETLDIITFVGRVATWTLGSLLRPHTLRPAAISRHIAETGIHALPIIGLMAVTFSSTGN